MKMVLKHRRFQ